MAAQPVITAEEKRIHELDEDVERIFDVRKRLGKGAYGIVWKAIERRQKNTVALKKIFDAFRDQTDAQRTYREVIFLRAFRHHPNIIRLIDVFKAGNNLDFYLVFEFMESDLHNVIKRGDILKDIHKRFVMYQLINAIKYMHSGNVVHRDLKPSNILIDSKCRLKVADFGLARTLYKKRNTDFDDLEHEAMLTDYVATRWYRAPEILVASRKYTKAIDMWSLGCILGEMIRQKPLFQGTSTINQIEKIVTALPDVTQQDIESIGASFGTVLLSKKINRDRRHSLEEMLRHCSDDAMSLLKSLLVLDPHRRLTAKVAILHPYVSRFRTASADMELRSDVHPPLRDDVRYHIDEYRSNLYDTVCQEQWSSARTVGNISPASNRETKTTTTTKPAHSASRTRTNIDIQKTTTTSTTKQAGRKTELNHLGVSTVQRNITQSWAETELMRNPAQTSSKQQASADSSSAVLKQQGPPRAKDVPQNRRTQPKEPTEVDIKLRRTAEIIAMARNTREALDRELAAVAATAPQRKINLWQSQAQAHVQFQSKAEAQVKALLHTKMPAYTAQLEKAKWGDKLGAGNAEPGGNAPAANKDGASMVRSQTHSKMDKEKKPQEKEPERKREKERDKQKKEREKEKHNQEDNRKNTKATSVPASTPAPASTHKPHRRDPTSEVIKRRGKEKRQKEGKPQELAKTEKEKLQEKIEEMKKDNERTRALGRQMGARCHHLLQLANKGATDMVLQLMTRKLQRLSEQKELAQAEKKQNSEHFYATGTVQRAEANSVLCYRARITHLEAEMAKCKEQLMKFLMENQEVLTHRRLRYHFNLLQPEMEEQLPNQSASGDPGAAIASDLGQSYEVFRLEQSKQKHLQLQEFLARDESNDFELPDLVNVYKAKSYHSFVQQPLPSDDVSPVSTPDSALSQSQERSTPSPAVPPSHAHNHGHIHGHGRQCAHNFVKLFPNCSAARLIENTKGQEDEQRPGQLQHMRMRPEDIQEARFLPRRRRQSVD